MIIRPSILFILLVSISAAAPEPHASWVVSGPLSRRAVAEELEEKLARVPSHDTDSRITTITFPPQEARYVRLMIQRTSDNSASCLDELEIYGPDSPDNLALAACGSVAQASSVIEGHSIHATAHLNDGLYGNDHSWIAASAGTSWAQIELPEAAIVDRVVISRDRQGRFRDRIIVEAELLLSLDGHEWHKAATLAREANRPFPRRHNPSAHYDLMPYMPVSRLTEKNWSGVLRYAFMRERDTWRQLSDNDHLSPLVTERPAYPGGPPYWGHIARLTPLDRIVTLFEEMIERLDAQGLNVDQERRQLAGFRAEISRTAASQEDDALYLAVRRAKRQLFFRDPAVASLDRVLFAKRHPFLESHNYSEHLDGVLEPGGGLYLLHLSQDAQGRLQPELAEVEQIFDGSAGIVRDPVLDYEAQHVYFAYRPETPLIEGWDSYWHLHALNLESGAWRRLTDGPYHDFDAVVLPDGGLAFHTTRCAIRFLCWRPQAYVLYRMEHDGTDIRRLSHANLSEWKPSVMSDGLILWTRSEYLDKGADFGHTLWTIRPDGTHPTLVFGNNTPNCYSQAHEVPGTNEIVCTLMSHGDHQGPIALIDRGRDPFDTTAITNITPDTLPHYQMSRSHFDSFRDPCPLSSDHFLVTHNPDNHHNWALYIIDRYGNRELLYVDPEISSKRPTPLRPRPRPPVLPSMLDHELAAETLGQFTVQDVYVGLGPGVQRGSVKYLRVVEEVPDQLELLACGQFQDDHPPFADFYAAPVHLVTGPAQSFLSRTENASLALLRTNHNWVDHVKKEEGGLYRVTEAAGWPSYVAKMSYGVVPVAEDGSANFLAPAAKQLYFQLLDAEYNEIQRMRSVVQLQPGERRSCIGCHEHRQDAPPTLALQQALHREPDRLEAPPWGAVPFAYEDVVQPVWDEYCVQCHNGRRSGATPDLRGTLDAERVPASYRALIEGGWVHYFDYTYGMRHFKAEPRSFGSLQSRLWTVMKDSNHAAVRLNADELHAVKAWIDMNCPLWPDYTYRLDRPDTAREKRPLLSLTKP